MTDVTGREIKEGDWLVRALRNGNSAKIKICKVTDNKLRTIGFEKSSYAWGKQKKQGDYVRDERQAGSYIHANSCIIPESLVPQDVIDLYNDWKNS